MNMESNLNNNINNNPGSITIYSTSQSQGSSRHSRR
ncbi:unnamed protein product [Schistosoma mattheei]|uniref:Uncharacterized protein n=1 Tax=Schistosoma mattheei TaxID=31246 RepID=A0A183PPZ6_9TREM|nr:unnamed protein product [Schistosoma mattheei]